MGGERYITRDPVRVVDEIQYWKERFDLEAINFLDANLTAKPSHITTICREMIDRSLNLKWWCDSRVNISLDLLEMMREAGCRWVSVGVETGSPAMLEEISKRITLYEVEEFVNRCRQFGIGVNMLMMVSHPNETVADVEQTYQFVKKMSPKIDSLGLGVTTIMPGSRIETIALEKGILPKDFSWAAPFESDLSRQLTSFPFVPVFIDRLSVEEIELYMTKIALCNEGLLTRIVKFLSMPSRWNLTDFKTNWLRLRHLAMLIRVKLSTRG